MTSCRKYRAYASGMCLRAAKAALVFAVALSTLYMHSPSAQAQTYVVIHAFTGGTDGANPYAGLTLGAAGNLYGVTQSGGALGYGTVFKLDPSGQETVLHSFSGSPADGNGPVAALIRDSAGNLYGTTVEGGVNNQGTVFEVGTAGTGEKLLYSFPLNTPASNPLGTLARDSAGNLYGTTAETVFKLDTAGHQTFLYKFKTGADGFYSESGLLLDAAGNVYGTTSFGGALGAGTVFEVDPAGNETVLYSFSGPTGGYPIGPLIEDAAGNFYGTTARGGPYLSGTVFKLDPTGAETVLYNFRGFSGGSDGNYPAAGLTADAQGNLYGTTEGGGYFSFGTVFKLDKNGKETVLHTFTGQGDGGTPLAGVVRDAAGNLYGTAYVGGDFHCYKFGCGVAFKIKP